MLCEISTWSNFLFTWGFLSFLGFIFITFFSGLIFKIYYVDVTYEKWLQKTNPKYPPADKVRTEIIMMTKGLLSATLCPTISLYLTQKGYLKAYCGVGEFGWAYLAFSFVVIWIFSDFFEFFYHRMGHKVDSLWEVHKWHHQFFNPTPFAVIADEYLDQCVRALPLIILPAVIPINMDLLFFEYVTFFYAYGVYLHWGHEFNYPDAHHPWINSSFQHYLHHAISIKNKPYHTGFFFKTWDWMFGSLYDGKCFCVKCSKSERTLEAYEKIEKPDYRVLLQPSFWLEAFKSDTKSQSLQLQQE